MKEPLNLIYFLKEAVDI